MTTRERQGKGQRLLETLQHFAWIFKRTYRCQTLQMATFIIAVSCPFIRSIFISWEPMRRGSTHMTKLLEEKKGADDVASTFQHFCTEIPSPDVREVEIFCDSCAGQNKNYTVFCHLHYSIHTAHRFDSVKVVFPIKRPFVHGMR